MDQVYSAEDEAFRAKAREWLTANTPDASQMWPMDTPRGAQQHRAWEATMAKDRWSVVNWPVEYGGRSSGVMQWLIFEEEYYRARAPKRVSQSGIFLLAPTMLEHATAKQKEKFLPRIADGSDIWCQGWSEPGAGSDLASIASRAERSPDGAGWILNGQKTWSSRAAVADWCFGIFRTGAPADRHRGLTYFLIPMSSPGVSVRPIEQIDGHQGFADIFVDDVFVPDENVLGEVGEGWTVAMSTASSERGLTLRSPARFTEAAGRLLDLYLERCASTDPHTRDLALQASDDVSRAIVGAEGYRVAALWAAARVAAGETIGAEASANKVFWSELDVQITETALAILGPEAELLEHQRASGEAYSPWVEDYIFSLSGPIYGGTNEIQRNIIAERLLGLPRS